MRNQTTRPSRSNESTGTTPPGERWKRLLGLLSEILMTLLMVLMLLIVVLLVYPKPKSGEADDQTAPIAVAASIAMTASGWLGR